MRSLRRVLALVFFASVAYAQREDVETLSRSDKWQVRYCVPSEFDAPTPLARKILERLARDANALVARQAFAVYAQLFVEVDVAIARVAFDRGDFDKLGVNVSDAKVFRSAAYWRGVLRRAADDSEKAEAVRALGLLRDTTIVAEFSQIESRNPYLLIQLAVALHRLGREEGYLERITAVLDLPVRDVYYQTCAVDCLLQTHPLRARAAWERIEASIDAMPDLQPNWVYRHTLLKARLP